MPDTDQMTPGEIGRRLVDIQNTVHDLSRKIEEGYVRTSELVTLDRRVSAMEAQFGWLFKSFIGGVITLLVGIIIARSTGVIP